MEKVMWSILMPCEKEFLKKNFHRCKSSISGEVNDDVENFSACCFLYLKRVRKYLDKGRKCAVWFNFPINISSAIAVVFGRWS